MATAHTTSLSFDRQSSDEKGEALVKHGQLQMQPRDAIAPLFGSASCLATLCASYVALYVAYTFVPDSFLRDVVYRWMICEPAAYLIDLNEQDESLHVVGSDIVSSRAVLKVIRGCDGIGVLILLTSALVAYPSDLRHKLLGITAALVLMSALNLARIVGLYHLVAQRSDWFVVAHSYVLPTMFITIAAAFFHWWAAARRS